jgi:hypothetical protein
LYKSHTCVVSTSPARRSSQLHGNKQLNSVEIRVALTACSNTTTCVRECVHLMERVSSRQPRSVARPMPCRQTHLDLRKARAQTRALPGRTGGCPLPANPWRQTERQLCNFIAQSCNFHTAVLQIAASQANVCTCANVWCAVQLVVLQLSRLCSVISQSSAGGGCTTDDHRSTPHAASARD